MYGTNKALGISPQWKQCNFQFLLKRVLILKQTKTENSNNQMKTVRALLQWHTVVSDISGVFIENDTVFWKSIIWLLFILFITPPWHCSDYCSKKKGEATIPLWKWQVISLNSYYSLDNMYCALFLYFEQKTIKKESTVFVAPNECKS